MARDMKTNRSKGYGKKSPFKGSFSKGFKDSETRAKRPFKKDGEDSSRPAARRNDETSERKPYRPFRKDEGSARSAPRRNDETSERKPYRPFRKDEGTSSRPAARRNDENSERKSSYRPFRKDEGTSSRPAARRNDESSERKSYRPFRKDGEASSRPSTRRNDESSERKSYRPFRKDGEASSRPAAKRNNAFQRRTTVSKPVLRGNALWGVHAVTQAWLNPSRTCFNLRATDSGLAALRDTLAKAEKLGLERPVPVRVERADIDALVARGTVHQGLLLEAEPLAELSFDDLLGRNEAAQLIVVLDQVTDPHNVGAVLRSAAALGAAAVLVTERHAPQATGVLAKTASGALEHVPVVCVVNMARTLDTLKDENFWCVGLAEEGFKTLDACTLSSGKIALVLGAEGEGLRRLTRERCDELAKLPTQGPIGSLNVSNAAAVALYEVARQRLSAGG